MGRDRRSRPWRYPRTRRSGRRRLLPGAGGHSGATTNALAADLGAAPATLETPVPDAAAQSAFPLSYGQRALWFLQQADPASPAYNTAFTARIRSRIDAARFRSALQALLDRH